MCTIGSCITKPGIVTSVVEECRLLLDLLIVAADKLAVMFREAREASERFVVRLEGPAAGEPPEPPGQAWRATFGEKPRVEENSESKTMWGWAFA